MEPKNNHLLNFSCVLTIRMSKMVLKRGHIFSKLALSGHSYVWLRPPSTMLRNWFIFSHFSLFRVIITHNAKLVLIVSPQLYESLFENMQTQNQTTTIIKVDHIHGQLL